MGNSTTGRAAQLGAAAAAALDRLADWIFGVAYWKLLAAALAVAILQHGLWMPPSYNLLLSPAQQMFHNPFPDEPRKQWILFSFLAPALAYLTGMAGSAPRFALLHALIFLAGFPLLMYAFRRTYGDLAARMGLIAFFLSALPAVVFTWLGMPDSYTVLFILAVAAFFRNPPALVLSAALMGVNHFEQGIIMTILLCIFLLIAREPFSLRATLAGVASIVAGLVLGRLGLLWFFDRYEYRLTFDRVDYLMANWPGRYIKSLLKNLPVLIFSLYQLGIVPLGLYIAYFRRSRPVLALTIVNALALAVMALMLDPTRVFALITFPVILLLFTAPRLSDLPPAELRAFQRAAALSSVGAVILPRLLIWDGAIISSAWGYLVSYLIDR